MDERKKREEALRFAENMNTFGGGEPSEYGKKLMQDYVDGKITLEENLELIKEHYKDLAKKCNE